MDIRILLEVLDAGKNQYKYAGPAEGQVYGVQVQNGSYPYMEGMLYVQPSLTHPHPPNNMCVIAGGNELYETLQKILLDYNRKESLLIRMQDKLNAFRSSETDMISGVMDNPCILLREDYKPLVWNGFEREEEFWWVSRIDFKTVAKKGQNLNICYQEITEEIPYPLMIVQYTNPRGKKRYCVLAGRDTRFDRVADPVFLKKICNILQCYTFTNNGIVQPISRLDELLESMVHEIPSQPELMLNELLKAGWVEKEKYYVLLIDVSLGKTKADDAEELSQKLNARVFSHDNYYVCLLTGTCAEEYDSRTHLGIEEFLAERNFYAGLSYGFFNIVNLSIGYKQAAEAVKVLLNTLNGIHYYAFADSIVTYLVNTSVNCGEFTMESLCHPSVYKIFEYDKKYGSDYMNFLRIYIYSGGSVKRTAEALYMHKNTVYQKIEKLKESFHVDVNDLYAYVKLYVSLVILEQMPIYNSNDFLKWM